MFAQQRNYQQPGSGLPGGADFSALPRLINSKPKFKDPYGRNIE